MVRKYQKMLIWLLLISLLGVTGCESDRTNTIPVTTNPVLTRTSTSLNSTPTTIPTYTATMNLATSIPLPTYTATIKIPTPTMLPTLFPEDAKTLLLDLMKSNGSCDLPCFWGKSLKETSVSEIRDFLIHFGEINKKGDIEINFIQSGDLGGIFGTLWNDGSMIGFAVQYRGEQEVNYLAFSAESMSIPFPIHKSLDYYMLPSILSRFGRPSEVWLGAYPQDPEMPLNWLPYNLVLFYAEKGIFLDYIMVKERGGAYYKGCPDQARNFSLITWDPSQSRSLMEVIEQNPSYWGMRPAILGYYKPFESATDMTIDEFVEAFSVSDENCIKTPVELWP